MAQAPARVPADPDPARSGQRALHPPALGGRDSPLAGGDDRQAKLVRAVLLGAIEETAQGGEAVVGVELPALREFLVGVMLGDLTPFAADAAPLRALFTKSVVARVPLMAGTVLTTEHLAVKKPGTGIPAARLPELLNRTVRRAIAVDTLLSEDDLD